MSSFNWPVNPSVTIPGPTEFVKDGSNVTVNLDTGTPANSRPLPVSVYGSTGVIIDFATSALQTAGNASLVSIDTKLTSQATAALQTTGNASLSSIDTKLSSQATAANQATEIAGLASIDSRLATSNVSLASIDTKLSSQATAALQGTGNTSLASIDTKLSSQATAAKQDTGNTSLASIDTKLTSQATAALQTTGNTSLASIDTKLTSQATAAKQDTGNTSLASIDTKLAANYGASTGAIRTAAQVGNASGAADFGSGVLSAQTLRVVLPTDQPAVPTKAPVNTNGNCANTALVATTASTAAVPANAVGFILQATAANTDPIRYRIGGTASTTAGMQLEPARDTGYIPCAANVSICATASGTNGFEIQWILSV